ncbi:DUF4153 domain-containing protein [Tissierella creatinini]|nr:DUF4153 domain-containing protein [Tissierella creatinini]TJX60638.1 DUF4153 domain-containing protein [Soehngenia saccharolytica]
MGNFISSISGVFKGAVKAFERYPMVIANAIAFTIVTIIRIHLDWPEQEAYNFLFNCLHLSFALGAIFSLTAITFAQSRYNNQKSFVGANIIGLMVTVVTFLLLYYLSGTYPEYSAMRYQKVSTLATARVSAAIFVSFLLFIILAAYPKEESDFSKSLFMVHKSFFIALLYGIVITSGTSGVAGAIKALLYKELSSKVYAYIGSLSGFLAFTIFIGYFPDFRKGLVDKQREIAQKQPRFIEVLFNYIMAPIMLALTLVLLLWTGKTIMEGMKVPFLLLSSIASSFAIGGIWLHIMLTHSKTGLAKFYKRIYSIAVIFILFFEAWALIIQLQKYGLKTTEYIFALIWIVALSSAILLIVKKERAHQPIAIIICILTIISVIPFVGYNVLPIKAQINRLENLLQSEGILQEEKLVPAIKEPDQEVRESITDSVIFLANSEDVRLPDWFDKDLINQNTFKTTLGFNQTYPEYDYEDMGGYIGTSLILSQEVIDISEYRWGISMQNGYQKEEGFISFEGNRGLYKIYLNAYTKEGIPSLTISLNDKEILGLDMGEYLDDLLEKYPPGKSQPIYVPIEDMSLKLESPEIEVMLVLGNVDINVDPQRDDINYWINMNALYIREKE